MTANVAPPHLYEEILKTGLSVRTEVTGSSMRPFLYGGEVVTIKSISLQELAPGDLVFYKNHYNRLLLHRLVDIKRGDDGAVQLFTKGDAFRIQDPPIMATDVLGKVFSIERVDALGDSKIICLESPLWKLLARGVVLLTWLSERLLPERFVFIGIALVKRAEFLALKAMGW